MENDEKFYLQMRRKFKDNFTKNIVPFLSKMEFERKKQLVIAIIITLIFLIIGLVCLYGFFKYWSMTTNAIRPYHSGRYNPGTYILFPMSLCFILPFFIWRNMKKSFEAKLKKKIMPVVCSSFDNLNWSHAYYPDGLFLSSSCAVPNFDSESYDDVFQCTHKNVKLDIVEALYSVRVERYGSRSRYYTFDEIFDGIVLRINMNKKFKGKTVVVPYGEIPDDETLHRLDFRDVSFAVKFEIYTNNDNEAAELITTFFMEKLKNLQMAFDTENVTCSFYQDSLVIAFETKEDLFSIGSLIERLDNNKPFFKMYNELESIIKLVDYFQIDEDIDF